jgi:hypothetical protein
MLRELLRDVGSTTTSRRRQHARIVVRMVRLDLVAVTSFVLAACGAIRYVPVPLAVTPVRRARTPGRVHVPRRGTRKPAQIVRTPTVRAK